MCCEMQGSDDVEMIGVAFSTWACCTSVVEAFIDSCEHGSSSLCGSVSAARCIVRVGMQVSNSNDAIVKGPFGDLGGPE